MPKTRTRLTVENLEQRQLLSVSSPSIELNDGAEMTNVRSVVADLTEFENAGDPQWMRFKINGGGYGTYRGFETNPTVTLPRYHGTNWVSVEVLYANGSRKYDYDSIHYASPKVQLNEGVDFTNLRNVTVSFSNLASDAEQVRFAFNGRGYQAPIDIGPDMKVTIPRYEGVNYLNAEIIYPNDQTRFTWTSIEYASPKVTINDGADLTNVRDATVSFDNLAPNAQQVRFAFNGQGFQEPVNIGPDMKVKIPRYEGNNYLSAEIIYPNDQTRFTWTSIEYVSPKLAINNGEDVTHTRDAFASLGDLADDAQSVQFAFNGQAYGSEIAISPEMPITLPNWDGDNYVNAKISYPDGGERIVWSSIDYMPDRDGDGLFDRWERNGIDINNDGEIDLELPNADPNHPDLYVEIDSMVGRAPMTTTTIMEDLDESLRTQTVLDEVVRSFDERGIHLHLQIDESDIPLANFPRGFTDFDVVKAERWGTADERSSSNADAILDAKRRAYRYAIFGNKHSNGNWSGMAELPGNDFMITLGSVNGGTGDQQAGTFMHELGHTLGLRHGGGDDENNKPNYHSVMNYSWQTPDGTNDEHWSLDYSDQKLPTLNEYSLSEPDGIGGDPDHADHEFFYCEKTATIFGIEYCQLGWNLPEHGPVDFNGDGDTTDRNVRKDINNDGQLELLHGHDDWSNLILPIGSTGDYVDGSHLTAITEDDWLGNSLKRGAEGTETKIGEPSRQPIAAAIAWKQHEHSAHRPHHENLAVDQDTRTKIHKRELHIADLDSLFAKSPASFEPENTPDSDVFLRESISNERSRMT